SHPGTAVTAANGAFTFEAMILTSQITFTSDQSIISMEQSGNQDVRLFQWNIDATGHLAFFNIGGAGFQGGAQGLSVAIPTTGPDAFVAGEWFHVAVTYNGAQNTANNLKMYWTRVDPSRDTANA